MFADEPAEKDIDYNEVMIHKYNTKDDNPMTALFNSVSLSDLQRWLERMKLDDNMADKKDQIKSIEREIEERYSAYLKMIEPLKDQISAIERQIEDLSKKFTVDIVSKRIDRLSDIISEAVSQDDKYTAENARAVLLGQKYDPLININGLSTLRQSEKEELYKIYLDEFRRMAGII